MLQMMAFFPHPPIVRPEVGGQESTKVQVTFQAMSKLAQQITEADPEIIVAITPHGHVFSDAVGITALDNLAGDLGRFGAPGVRVSFPLARDALHSVLEKCQTAEFICAPLDDSILRRYKLPRELDHGLVLPLSFLAEAGWQGSLLPVNMALFPYEELYHFGACLANALDSLGKKWVLLVSGDLSHRLLPQAPAGYSPQGAVFDEVVRQAIREGDVKRLLHLDHQLIEEAGECGLRPLIMGLGAFEGFEIHSEEFSYEGPFGVGYLVAKLLRGSRQPGRQLVAALYRERQEACSQRQEKESAPVRLARRSIKTYLDSGRFLDSSASEMAELLEEKAGAFVSLKKHGQLRGCIGTIEPSYANLAEEIIHNAVAAAFRDPRFDPLEPEELDQLTISVDILGSPEKVESLDQLDPKVYGVIVRKGYKRGLLLPDLPGINTAEEQVRIAKQKAGIGPGEKAELQRFTVTRYT